MLQQQHSKYKDTIRSLLSYPTDRLTLNDLSEWHFIAKKAKKQIRTLIQTTQHLRQDEWINSKNHAICIGKIGAIVRMMNPKSRKGPIASKIYPAKPNEPVRRAVNDRERKEATLLTHQMWMDNPPGLKNCHFIETTNYQVGINGVRIEPDKEFDENAEWKYLEGILSLKTDEQIAERIRLAHKKTTCIISSD